MPKEENLRFQLRAFEGTGCCRLASILLALTTEPPTPIDRGEVAENWANRYPRHAEMTGKHNVRGRISDALSVLKAAGVAQAGEEEQTIVVVNVDHLRMAAGNLAIVEDADGVAIRPGLWAERPTVPDYLIAVQQTLIDSQTAES